MYNFQSSRKKRIKELINRKKGKKRRRQAQKKAE